MVHANNETAMQKNIIKNDSTTTQDCCATLNMSAKGMKIINFL